MFVWLTGILNDIPTFRLNKEMDSRQFARISPAGHVLGLNGKMLVLCLLSCRHSQVTGMIAGTAVTASKPQS